MASIQEQLAAARETSERRHPVSLPLPGYKDGALVVRYRAPDWEVMRGYVRSQALDAPTNVELEAIADGLVAASVGSEAHLDGETHDLGHPLGKGLADFLGISGAQNDREAVHLIIPDDMDLVNHWNDLITESHAVRVKVQADVSGESLAG